MAEINIYREFYCININVVEGKTVTDNRLLDPDSLAACSTISYSGSTIEDSLPVTRESEGVYYATLNPELYSYDNTYEVCWNVSYIPGAPNKKLITRFKLNPVVVGQNLEIEVQWVV